MGIKCFKFDEIVLKMLFSGKPVALFRVIQGQLPDDAELYNAQVVRLGPTGAATLMLAIKSETYTGYKNDNETIMMAEKMVFETMEVKDV
jgi:hypothetical protein